VARFKVLFMAHVVQSPWRFRGICGHKKSAFVSAGREVATPCETPKLPPPVSGFHGASSGDRRLLSAHPRDKAAGILLERLAHSYSITHCARSCALQQFAFDLLSSLVKLRKGNADVGPRTVDQQPRLIVVAVTVVFVGNAPHVTAVKSIGQNPSLRILYTDA
jgi:hypothetical protein